MSRSHGPRDGLVLEVVGALVIGVGFTAVARVKEVRATDPVELPQPPPHVLVVACGEKPTSRSLKRIHRRDVARGERCAALHRLTRARASSVDPGRRSAPPRACVRPRTGCRG